VLSEHLLRISNKKVINLKGNVVDFLCINYTIFITTNTIYFFFAVSLTGT